MTIGLKENQQCGNRSNTLKILLEQLDVSSVKIINIACALVTALIYVAFTHVQPHAYLTDFYIIHDKYFLWILDTQ